MAESNACHTDALNGASPHPRYLFAISSSPSTIPLGLRANGRHVTCTVNWKLSFGLTWRLRRPLLLHPLRAAWLHPLGAG